MGKGPHARDDSAGLSGSRKLTTVSPVRIWNRFTLFDLERGTADLAGYSLYRYEQ